MKTDRCEGLYIPIGTIFAWAMCKERGTVGYIPEHVSASKYCLISGMVVGHLPVKTQDSD